METAKTSRAKYWVLFLLWLVALIAMLAIADYRQWFWLALPGVTTYFCKGMDIM